MQVFNPGGVAYLYKTLGLYALPLRRADLPSAKSVIEPTTPRGSAVPTAGKPRPRPDSGAGGIEPQPVG